MYNVSNTNEIAENDILTAMDQEIVDSIDIMLLSIGFEQIPYFKEAISIGSLSAYEKGIVVVSTAGIEGSYTSKINVTPWILAVGDGTINQSFIGTMTLGNGQTFEGISTF
ncbi:hypothetical protein V6N13_048093 [Hibiscus sabdariffa]